MASITKGSKRSEEHTSELQSPVVISYAVFCLKKKKYKSCIHLSHYNKKKQQIHKIISKYLLFLVINTLNLILFFIFFFFFNDTATTEIYTTTDTLSLHDALPIS